VHPVGRINSYRAALAFVDFLRSQNVHANVSNGEDYVVISVADEQHIGFAQQELKAFLEHPDDPKYWDVSWQTGTTAESNQVSFGSGEWARELMARAGPVVKVLALISIAVTFLTGFGSNDLKDYFYFIPSLIIQGEIYRLITPIFLHFEIWGIPFIHLLFNVMWIWELGGMLEKRLGSAWLIYFTITSSIVSNFSQWLASGHEFGGLSGVVYALVGYFFVRGEIDKRLGVKINPNIFWFLMIWMGLGFTGILGSVANAAHLMGFVAGVALAWADVHLFRFRRYY